VNGIEDNGEYAKIDKIIVKDDKEGSNKSLCVGVDYERYQRYLDNSDLSDEEKQQVIQALWDVIVNFVDLGIGVHPLQQTGANNTDSSNVKKATFQAAFENVAHNQITKQMEGVDV